MKVSVLMPVYNGAAFVEQGISSILSQSLPDFEFVIVDDGSTDETPEILARHAALDRRIKIITLPHGGIVKALNAGLAETTGELIARMDADDLCGTERLTLQREYLLNHPGIGLVASRVAYGGDAEVFLGLSLYVDWTNGLLDSGQIAAKRFVESPFIHPSVMFRRELAESYGGYRDGPFPEDYELWLRWLDAGVQMARIPEELVTWRERGDRLTRTDSRYSTEAFYRCKSIYLARWLEEHNKFHPKVVVWGAGRETRKRAGLLVEEGVAIRAYVDIDPRKIGRHYHERPVWSPEMLPPPGEIFLLSYVASRGARSLIGERLASLGYEETRDYLFIA